jgi:signal transduction histidine kinase
MKSAAGRFGSERRQVIARWSKLIAAILSAQLAYWLVVYPAFQSASPPPETIPVFGVETAALPSPDKAALAQAQFTPDRLVWTGCCDPAYYAVRLTFDLDTIPESGLAMTPSVMADNVRIYINGTLAFGEGRMELPNPTIERLRSLWFLPPGALVRGENKIDIITSRASQPYTDVTHPRIGLYPDMKAAYGFREFLFHEYTWFSISLCGLIALSAIVLYWRGGFEPAYLWLFLLSASWAFHLGLAFWREFPSVYPIRVIAWQGAELLIGLSWASLANEWGRKPLGWLRLLLPLVAIATFLTNTALLLTRPMLEGYDLTSEILLWASVGFACMSVLLCLRHAVLFGEKLLVETALFILIGELLATQALGTLDVVSYSDPLEFTAPLIFIALATAFLSRNIHLFRSMEEYNARLAAELAEREQEIADSYAERQKVARQQALLAERQRIMRDMHDGIGGRLMSIAAQLRREDTATPPPEQVANELLEALDELRLIVDSLDTAGDDLGLALGAFRGRMEGKLRAAGIESVWRIDDEAAERSLPASAILDVYRIMQEACTNMLRHSGASRFEMTLRRDEDGTTVLDLSDNGRGLQAGAPAGKGIANMQSRAARLGATLDIQSGPAGLRISLRLPA